MAAALLLVCGLFLGFCLCFVMLLKGNEIWYRRKGLPPGTMGWPLFGETTEFLKHGPDYLRSQRERYGNLFKSHILGCPTIISLDAETNRYILLNEGKGLVPGYPQSMLDILGKCNIAAVDGSVHKLIRGSMLSLISPPVIRDHLLGKIDASIGSNIRNWGGKTIDVQERITEMVFAVVFKQIVDMESDLVYDKFKPAFDELVAGTLSMPINVPGTAYHCGLKGRQRIIRIMRQIIKDRRVSSRTHDDILGQLLENKDPKYCLSDEEIIDQIITILYSGYETVSTTSMMALKYLHDHPDALQEIRAEHLAIRARKKPGQPIDWQDYKTMRFTRAVILETSRLATVVNGLLRKTTQDIELNGYVIPKGWRIYVYTRETNYDPFLYPEPLTFNPWRWQEKDMESHKHCFLFGGGSRLCPGKELGMVQVSTFLHHLVTQYRWKQVGESKILEFPRVVVQNGLHMRVSNY